MRIGKREQIVIGVLAGVGVIAALHFLFYREAASDYQQAKSEYQSAVSSYTSGGSPRSWADINAFDYRTINRQLEFWEVLQNSNLALPPLFMQPATTQEELDALLDEQRYTWYEMLEEIQVLRNDGQGAELTFLDDYDNWEQARQQNARWGILEELPESIEQTGTDITDLLRLLNDTNEILQSAPEDSDLARQKEQEYTRRLFVFGLDLIRREQMEERLGQLPAILMTLNRIDLVREAVPPSELGILTADEYTETLRDLFRLEWDDIENPYPMYRQMLALRNIIQKADEHGIDEILNVRMWEDTTLRWPPKEEREPEETEDDMGMMGMEGMMFEDEAAMYEMMMMGMGDMEGMGMGRGAEEAAEPEVDENAIGSMAPIELRFTGTTPEAMSFLHDINTDPRMYYVDMIEVISNPQSEEGLITVRAVINIVVALNAMVMGEDAVDEKLEELRAQKHLVAQQEGASQLAAEEGFVPDPEQAAEQRYWDLPQQEAGG